MARCLIRLVLGCLSIAPLHVSALDMPTGPVLLVVGGNVANPNIGDEAHFDRAMLESLAQYEILTETPWHDGQVHFSGPLGRAILEAAGGKGDEMRIKALNDYSAAVPTSDFYQYDVILAMQADGKEMSVRDLGPLFVIYPFADEPELMHDLSEVVASRSVWQVKRIDIN